MSIKLTFPPSRWCLPAACDDRHAPSLCQLSTACRSDRLDPIYSHGSLVVSPSCTHRHAVVVNVAVEEDGWRSRWNRHQRSQQLSPRWTAFMPDEPASYIATGAVQPIHIPRAFFRCLWTRDTALRGLASSGRAGLATWGYGSVTGWRRADNLVRRFQHMGGSSYAVQNYQNYIRRGTRRRRNPQSWDERAPRRPSFSLFSAVDRKRQDVVAGLMRASDVLADDRLNYGKRLPLQQ